MSRPPNTSVRRAQIAHAMVRLLARHGLAGATMRALSAETGLTQGLLHYHFPSKQEMVGAALEELEGRLRERLKAAEARGGEPLDALVDALLAADDPALPTDGESLAAWVAIGDAAQADTLLRVAYGDALARLHGLLRDRLTARAFQADPAWLDALAGAALSQVEGAWRIGRIAPWAMPPGVAARTLREMLAGMLAAGVSPPSLPSPSLLPPPFSRPPVATPASRPRDPGVRLRARERRWFEELGAAAPFELSPSLWTTLLSAYTAPGRHYHTLEHLVELARCWRDVAAGPGWEDPRAAWLAVLFHDAVQERTGPPGQDEDRSAALLGALIPDSAAAQRLIRLTASHGHARGPLDPDAAHFLDADLAILGAAPARFDRYEAQIAAEYADIYPVEMFRLGRRAFLERMLTEPRLYASEWFHTRLDRRARSNVARVLAVSARG